MHDHIDHAIASMQGRSLLPLMARQGHAWTNEVYIELSEALTGRALRTPQWTYAVANPRREAASALYNEYMLYDRFADPYQHVNLAGRTEYREISQMLRERLLTRIVAAGSAKPVIDAPFLPYV